ncbi:fungal tRNA ligase phosphodiesterase domain-containing protein [Sarocladium implicatum]|nr:fungal tRNA ligase phosphodiesterase domain-containing protein [Sarocladium implicatum]
MEVPYVPQDPDEVNRLVAALEASASSKKKGGFSVKKTKFDVKDSRDGLTVNSWRMQDWDYKRRDLPTYARGLFTTRGRNGQHEIAVRGYDKFFNVDEVHNTKWDVITSRTQGPYELTLKENGCIIFISGMADDTLLVCSKHSTGDRADINVSHASAGERRLDQQLQAIGKTRSDLARELYQRNATAVAELCDDDFEEHILAYGPEKAGLYLHGINLNLPRFTTYSSALVQEFGDAWGFRKVGLMVMDDIQKVKAFLEEVAETGAHEGRDVEGFVVRCKMTDTLDAPDYYDWFFKFKFEEPYLMYRQWRECTKALIAGKPPKFRKHVMITEQYLMYARKRLAADPKLGAKYNQNHGIIALRDDFLNFKNLKGADAANMDDDSMVVAQTDVTSEVILCPIATIGCGKTTLAIALAHLFHWGHVQNDNISGKGRPPRFTKAVLGELTEHAVVFADRNNAQRHERKQLLTDVKQLQNTAKVVCLNFRHDEGSIDEIRRITQQRVLARGDNHQTIHAASQKDKYIEVMEGFIGRYEPCNPHAPPDNRFDHVIDLNPTAGSRKNLETTIEELQKVYPNLIKEMPTSSQLDEAMVMALGYQPTFKHTIASHGKKDSRQQQAAQSQPKKARKPQLEYMSVNVPATHINAILDKAFQLQDASTSRFFKQLKQTRRVQPKFHVTLMHRAASKQNPELWQRYAALHDAVLGESSGQELPAVGECQVELERIVFDDRIMALVVRLVDGQGQWECTNQVAHITIGTRDDSVKPKESNDLLARWLEEGTASGKTQEVVLESKPLIEGVVKPVQSR